MRLSNPAGLLPGAMDAIQALCGAAYQGGVDPQTMSLVHLRASQLNRCEACLAQATPEQLKRLEEGTGFSPAERAALALSEEVTRLGEGGVSDAVWSEAARHYDEKALAALVLWIGVANLFNRMNVATRQPAGAWK